MEKHYFTTTYYFTLLFRITGEAVMRWVAEVVMITVMEVAVMISVEVDIMMVVAEVEDTKPPEE